ncbi:spore cortex biosynthesis protein YabQ [Allobacillus sp. GCM10007491]|uniref:Spore cortex biosynthesis protein YabQ n=1 Tax=Allobacillus saliphilus TaxID=2912308 RepID=A0A941CW67_9BACI|nr:spore cortex biosynthesis protein YabQ [Allobacillus saliphilus]MBR7554309.1 spore cortex biosynthesis protein YabQ [Allobacillus saliphilus]
MTLSVQFLSMAVMVAGGIQAALTFDTYKQLFRPASFWRQIGVDIVFFLTEACVLFYFLYQINGGILKFYLFLAVALGISVYYALLQNWYLWLLDKLVRLVKGFVGMVLRILNRIVFQPIIWILLQVFTLIVFILHILQKVIGLIGKMVWWLVGPLIPEKIKRSGLSFLTKCSRIKDKLLFRIKAMMKR